MATKAPQAPRAPKPFFKAPDPSTYRNLPTGSCARTDRWKASADCAKAGDKIVAGIEKWLRDRVLVAATVADRGLVTASGNSFHGMYADPDRHMARSERGHLPLWDLHNEGAAWLSVHFHVHGRYADANAPSTFYVSIYALGAQRHGTKGWIRWGHTAPGIPESAPGTVERQIEHVSQGDLAAWFYELAGLSFADLLAAVAREAVRRGW